MTQMEHLSMNYDDGNIPEIDLPGNTLAAETIPDEIPRRDGPGGETSNVIPDEIPGQSGTKEDSSGDIPQEIPQRGCPGRDSAYKKEAVL